MEFQTPVLRSTLVGVLPQRKPEDLVVPSVETLEVRLAGSAAEIEAAFVAKAAVVRWPVFGPLAKLQRTIFIERTATRASVGNADQHGADSIRWPATAGRVPEEWG